MFLEASTEKTVITCIICVIRISTRRSCSFNVFPNAVQCRCSKRTEVWNAVAVQMQFAEMTCSAKAVAILANIISKYCTDIVEISQIMKWFEPISYHKYRNIFRYIGIGCLTKLNNQLPSFKVLWKKKISRCLKACETYYDQESTGRVTVFG